MNDLEATKRYIQQLELAIELKSLEHAGLTFLLLREQTKLMQLEKEKKDGVTPPSP